MKKVRIPVEIDTQAGPSTIGLQSGSELGNGTSFNDTVMSWQTILDEINEGLILVEKSGIIIYSNKRFSEMTGNPQKNLSGSYITSYIALNDHKRFEKLLSEAFKNPSVGVISIKSGENTIINTRISMAVHFKGKGKVASIVISEISRIKDNKEQTEEMTGNLIAEPVYGNNRLSDTEPIHTKKEVTIEAIARKYKTLYTRMRESEEKYKDLVEFANSIIMKVDTTGKITYLNRFGLDFFGYSEVEIIGRQVAGTIVPLRGDRGLDTGNVAESIIANPDQYKLNENRNMRKDGSYVWVSWTNKILKARNGNPIGVLAIGNDITKLIETERALAESEEKFRTIIETASEGIIIGALDGRISYLNSKMCEMLAYSRDDILGRLGSDVISPGQKLKARRMRKILESQSCSNEFKFTRKDGTTLWTSCNASPILDKNGSHIFNLFMHTDVTERKKTEEELFRSNERFRSAFDDGAIAMAITSSKGKLLKVNHVYSNLTGYTEEELNGMMFQDLTHPDDLAANISGYNQILNGKRTSFRMEKRYIRKDGSIVWVDISTAPVRDLNGKIEYMVTHIQDISEIKKKEHELRSSREKLEMALESGFIGVWERDLKTNKIIFDQRMEKIFNIEPGSFKGDYSYFEDLVNEDDLPYYRKALKTALEKGSYFETVFRAKIGGSHSKYISTKAIIRKDDNGVPVSITGICFDVTRMKEGAERDIMKINEELLRSNRELENFAYVASHDLQEPLRMISSFTQLLSQRYGNKLDRDAKEFIQYAVEGASRMQSLINDLLNYSRINTRIRQDTLVDFNKILEQVIRDLELKISEKNAVITSDNLPKVIADRVQMVQLLQNLIGNALKFCKKQPRIHVSASEGKDNYLFSVKDNGFGIEEQYFERIFQIFQRLHAKDEYGGTGIGLAICKRIVENHGGKIWVESTPGRGSIFNFSILKSQ